MNTCFWRKGAHGEAEGKVLLTHKNNKLCRFIGREITKGVQFDLAWRAEKTQ